MPKNRRRSINLRSPTLWDFYKRLQRAAAGNAEVKRMMDAAISSNPLETLDAEVRAMAARILDPGTECPPKTYSHSKPVRPAKLETRVSLTMIRKPGHGRRPSASAHVRLWVDGRLVYASPKQRVPRLRLPANGRAPREFREGMVQRGWESELQVYLAQVRLAGRFSTRSSFHPDACSIESSFKDIESLLAPFKQCIPLRGALAAGNLKAAWAHLDARLQQLVEEYVRNRGDLLSAARLKRDQKAAQVFRGRISLRRPSSLGRSLSQLLLAGAPSDTDFYEAFSAMKTWANTELPPGLKDPRQRVLQNLENLQRSLLDDWESQLARVRDLLAVLDADVSRKLETLLAGPHESNLHAIMGAAQATQNLIAQIQPDVDRMNGAVADCIRSMETHTESVSQAITVLETRDTLSKSILQFRLALDASADALREHLQTLEHAQAQHISRELAALVTLAEAQTLAKKALGMRQLIANVQRLPGVVELALKRFLSKAPMPPLLRVQSR